LDEAERKERWQELADCYLAQQLSLYPADYVRPDGNSTEHLLETVERFEEDLTDVARVHGAMHAVVEVGESIAVSTNRPPKGTVDPLLGEVRQQLETMLAHLAAESVIYHDAPSEPSPTALRKSRGARSEPSAEPNEPSEAR